MSTVALDFVSRDCKNGTHQSCHHKWEGMGFEIICVCGCGHKSHRSQILEKKEFSASAVRGPDQRTAYLRTNPRQDFDLND